MNEHAAAAPDPQSSGTPGIQNELTQASSPKKPSASRRRRRWAWISIGVAIVVALGCAYALHTLQPSFSRAFDRAASKERYETTVDGRNFTLPYRLYVPESLGVNERLPVMLYLGGSGQLGTDNVSQVVYDGGVLDTLVTDHTRMIVIAPQLPDESLAQNPDVLAAYVRVTQAVADTYHADVARLYAYGWSMGADSEWQLLARYPHTFAAAVIICGGLFNVQADAPKLKSTPVWIFHGSFDYFYPAGKTHAMVRAINAVGGHAKYTEYPFGGHVIWQKVYADPKVLPWLLDQRLKGDSHAGA